MNTISKSVVAPTTEYNCLKDKYLPLVKLKAVNYVLQFLMNGPYLKPESKIFTYTLFGIVQAQFILNI